MLRRHLSNQALGHATPIPFSSGFVSASSVACTSFRAVINGSGTGTSYINESTKGNPNMRHLDIYARRDPQLAPYLLREVDIEYKRRCRKVNFLVWMTLFTAVSLFQSRESLETAFYMKNYTQLLREELDSKDDDMDLRRGKMVQLLKLVKDVEKRARGVGESLAASGATPENKGYNENLWTESETQAAIAILRSQEIPEQQKKLAAGARDIPQMDLAGRATDAIMSIKR